MINMKKTYYYDKSLETINSLGKDRPILGIHVCCGPCSAFPLEFLFQHFKIKILYANSNIYPREEYDRRLNELIRFVECFNRDYNADIEFIIFDYDNEEYNRELGVFGAQKEGGDRCKFCYRKRMDLCYGFADKNNYDYFTTVMTISRQKDSFILNQIGEELSKKYKTKYFYSDFKKKKGVDRGRELRLKYDLYNQQYCGCIYSFSEYLAKEKAKQ